MCDTDDGGLFPVSVDIAPISGGMSHPAISEVNPGAKKLFIGGLRAETMLTIR